MAQIRRYLALQRRDGQTTVVARRAYEDKLGEIGWELACSEFGEVMLKKLDFVALKEGGKCMLSVSIFNAAFFFGNASCTVGDGDKQESKTTHGVYQVKVEQEERTWLVDKRYTDFYRLHQYFSKKRGADGHGPPINVRQLRFPPKTLFRKANTNNVMEERLCKFEQYLRGLLVLSHRHRNKMYINKLSEFLKPQGH